MPHPLGSLVAWTHTDGGMLRGTIAADERMEAPKSLRGLLRDRGFDDKKYMPLAYQINIDADVSSRGGAPSVSLTVHAVDRAKVPEGGGLVGYLDTVENVPDVTIFHVSEITAHELLAVLWRMEIVLQAGGRPVTDSNVIETRQLPDPVSVN